MNARQRRVFRRQHNLTRGNVGDVVHWRNPFGGISTGVVLDSSAYGDHLRCVQTESAHNNRPLVLMKDLRAGTGAAYKN